MTDISISLSNIQNIKTVKIDPIGVIRVRRLGAGEELDLSDKLRRLGKIVNELQDMDFAKFNSGSDDDLEQIKKLSKRAEKLSDEISDIKRYEFTTYKKCLSDDDGGKVVDEVMNTLSDEERSELFKQIFNPKIVESSEDVTPDEAKDE